MQTRAAQSAARLASAAHRAQSLNPYGVLARGYAIVEKDGKPTKTDALMSGDEIFLHGASANASCTVKQVFPLEVESK